MADRRGSRRSPDYGSRAGTPTLERPDSDAVARKRSPAIAAPTSPPITYRGEQVTPGMVIRLWRRGMAQRQKSRDRILKCRAMRRMEAESLIGINARWARRNPEVASWAQDVLEQRITLDQDLIAKAGSVEPEFSREPLGFLDSDHADAEACEAYLEEWRLQNMPTQTCFGKSVEDGEFALVVLPGIFDMEGCPDFFEYLDERAYELLDDDERKAYDRDEKDRRKRYVKRDERGRKKVNPRYDKDDDEKSKQAHQEAVTRYLLTQDASTVRVIPALDCVGIFSRGTKRGRWELTALVERQLYYPEELLEPDQGSEGYGWPGLGDRKLVPLAYNADGTSMSLLPGEMSQGEQVYVYTAYIVCRDKQGKKHPVLATTVGGQATWDGTSGDPDDPNSVVVCDLYEKLGIQEPLWSYHFGPHTEDDDPDNYAHPHLWKFYTRIRVIEGNKTSINAATGVHAFTGHFYTPDGKLAEVAPEAVLEQDGELFVPKMPAPGEIEPSGGVIVPANQARVGEDAWRSWQADSMSLQAATAIDQMPAGGQSAVSQTTQLATGQVAKRHIRDCVKEAVISAGEKHLRILHAYCETFDVRWPIQTTQERPVGQELRSARQALAYDPDWVGDGYFNLSAEYPEEENLARQDMEMAAAERGFGNFERVARAMGEKDSESAYIKVLKDKMRQHPAYLEAQMISVGQKTGNKEWVKIVKGLQEQQKMTKAGVPGAANGIPMAALNRPGEGGGRQSVGAQQRGGISSGEMGADRAQANAEAALTQSAPPGMVA